MKVNEARALYATVDPNSGAGLDARLRKLGISRHDYRERKAGPRGGTIGAVPTPRPAPTSPHLNYPIAGGIAQ